MYTIFFFSFCCCCRCFCFTSIQHEIKCCWNKGALSGQWESRRNESTYRKHANEWMDNYKMYNNNNDNTTLQNQSFLRRPGRDHVFLDSLGSLRAGMAFISLPTALFVKYLRVSRSPVASLIKLGSLANSFDSKTILHLNLNLLIFHRNRSVPSSQNHYGLFVFPPISLRLDLNRTKQQFQHENAEK